MKRVLFRAMLGSCLLALSARCGAEPLSPPEATFEALWHSFDDHYGNFEAKGVDWDLVYRVYRPQVTADLSDNALFSLLCSMLDHLNDGHVQLTAGNRSFHSGSYGVERRSDFSREVIVRKYLHGNAEERDDGDIIYGKLTDRIGYFHFANFANYDIVQAADAVVALCGDCDGVVIDLRDNGGGEDHLGRKVAGRFADAKHPYLKTRIKKGRGEFAKPVTWYIEPEGEKQFTGRVIVITNRNSASAAEVFTLGMRTLPYVIHIGDRTLGVFADTRTDTLPNGWEVSYPFTRFTDQNDFCWEGIGVTPQLRVVNAPEDMAAGQDRPVEFAIRLIEPITR